MITSSSPNQSTSVKTLNKFLSRLLNRLSVLPLTLPLCLVLVLGVGNVLGQYFVNFEGAGETNTDYAAATVSLSGINWSIGPEALIGNQANDWKNGSRSLRLRARNGSLASMTANKANGIGTISFSYRRYGSDGSQQPYAVEYSTNNGSSWTQIGSNITGTATVQTFNQTVNVTGNIRIRFRLTTSPGTSGDRRLNIDDINITNYTGAATPTLTASTATLSGFNYVQGGGPSQLSYTLSGTDLVSSGNIVVTAPTNYQVSLTSGSGYANSINVPFASGIVTGQPKTIYVRLIAGLNAQCATYSGNITHTGGDATAINVAVQGTVSASLLPPLHNLSSSNFTFTTWANSNQCRTYPASMRFWRTSGTTILTSAVTTDAPANYEGAYDLGSASRISGQGANGVSFVATGSEGAGIPFGAAVGLNTTGRENIQVSFLARMISQATGTPTPREYRLRLQYRVGASGSWVNVAGPVEYTSAGKANNSSETITATLPSACNNQAQVFVRWVYYEQAANDDGNRPEIGLDDITISSSPLSYTVTFNGNGSTGGSMANQTASSATNLTANAFTRTGYTFAGWNTAANGSGTAYANGASYPFTSSTTLYAQWTANTLSVTYDSQGGSAITSGSTTTGGSIASSPGTPTKAGYTFNGWFAASSGGSAITFPYTHGQTANFTLYAQWTANTLTITYDSQGGSSISNGSTTTGGSVSNPGNPTRSGYSFNGWFVASSGGSAISFPYTHGQTSNFTLYAQWTVASTPTIDPVTLASALSTTYGTASSGISFTASGSNLSVNITATAQSGYQVSDDNITYGSSVSISSGTTIYVRFTATQAAGTYNNSTAVVLTSTGATSQNVTTSSSSNTVSQKGLTITGISISNKTYDATTTATISGTAAYSGLVNSESFSVTGSPTAVFNNKNVGTAKPITVSGYTAPSANYSVTQPTSLTADITTKTLTITSPAVTSKTYDGTTNATITGTLSGVESGDAVTLTGTGTFASANVGTGINVTSTSSLSGSESGNYSLTQPTGLTGNITSKALTITANNVTKEMGQVLSGGAGSTAFSSSGLVGSETIGSVTISYGAAGGATGQGATLGTYANQVTPSAATGGSFTASNYSITYASGAIIVGGFTAGNLVVERIGDGSTTLSSAASSINLVELNTSGSTIQTLSSLFTGSNLLTESGSAGSNGYLNSYNSLLGVPGYNSALATATVASSNTKATNIIGTGASVTTRVVFPTSTSSPFNGNNFRSIIPTSATTFYASGTSSGSGSPNGGIWYYDGSAFTQVSTTQTNTRNVEIFSGNLYFSTGSGTRGIYQVGTGLPPSSNQTATLVVETGSSSSPYGFVLSPDGNTMYVADDRTSSSGGIYKFTKSGGTWSQAYLLGTGVLNIGARGMMVDFSGSDPIIYATTAETAANRIIKITDTGSGSSSSTLATAASNYVFRGVDFTPAAAPNAPAIGTVTHPTCATATGSIELTGLPSGQWRIYGTPSGSAVGTGSSTTISGLSAGSYTFLVTSYTGRTSVASSSVTINAQPGAPGIPSTPTASAQSLCSGSTVADLTVTSGSSIRWYDAASNGNLLASGTALTAGNYYASQTVSGCESSTRTSVAVTINSTGTWIGDATGDWNVAGNWCGGVPNSSSAVVSIPANVTVNLDASPSVLNLTLGSGTTINSADNTISVASGGSFTNNGGSFASGNGTLIFSGSGTLGGSSATTLSNLTVNGALSVNPSPTVNGTVTINNGGSITTNPIIYGANSTLVYNTGGSISSTNNEWPTSNSPRNVTIQNTSNITLNSNKDVIGMLTMTSGDIITGSNRITLGNSSDITGTLTYSSGKIIGELRRYFANETGTNYSFPVGNATYKRGVTINFTAAPGADQYLTVAYRNGEPILDGELDPLYTGLPFTTVDGQLIQNYSKEGYWEINPTAYDSGIDTKAYQITLEMNNIGGVNDYTKTRLIRAKGPSHTTWEALTHISSSGSNSNYTITASGTGFSWFAGGGDDNNNPLPVELLYFNGQCTQQGNVLRWATASEFNSSHFDAEKSRDGENWNVVNTIAAAGFSAEKLNYQTVDMAKNEGTMYYRLRQVDINGEERVYNPIAVTCGVSGSLLTTYPNPSGESFTLLISDESLVGQAILNIRDINGRLVTSTKINILSGSNSYEINEALPSGMYFIQVENGTKVSSVLRQSVR